MKIFALKILLFILISFLIILFGNFIYTLLPHNRTTSLLSLLLSVNNRTVNVYFDKQKEKIINFEPRQNETPYYFSVKNIGSNIVYPNIIVNGKNWSSEEAIIKTIFKDSKSLSDEEKAIKIFNYVSQNIYHFYQPHYNRSEFSLPVNFLNILGYGLCSDAAYIFSMFSNLVDLEARVVHVNHESSQNTHWVAEAYFNSSWHMFDVDRGAYYRNIDNSITSVKDLFNNPELIDKSIKYKDGDWQQQYNTFKNGWIRGIEDKEKLLELIKNRTENFTYSLLPQEEIRFYYNWSDSWYWNDFPQKPPIFTNGLLISTVNKKDLANNIKMIKLPYVILKSKIQGLGLCRMAQNIYFSQNGLDKWESLKSLCVKDSIDLTKFFPNGKDSNPKFSYFLKFEKISRFFPIFVYTQFQVAPKSIPILQAGDNKIELQNTDNDKVKLQFVFQKK